MSTTIIITIISLSVIGIIAAMILYFVAQKFKVYEDPRIDEVDEALPGANCGGCGYPGCRGFAEACVKSESLGDLYCPVGGNECMSDVARVLGREAVAKEPDIAVLLCAGACSLRPNINQYDGASSCTIAHNLYGGETGCQFGCLGLGECVDVCDFDALHMDVETGLPIVDEEKCTACGACVKQCPRNLFELRAKGKKGRRIYVACSNKEKGAAKKIGCEVACIGCRRCVKECAFDAITVENFNAYIDPQKCKLCRKCAPVCPTNAIHELNFPPRKIKEPALTGDPTISTSKSTKEESGKIEVQVKEAPAEPKQEELGTQAPKDDILENSSESTKTKENKATN